METRYQAREEEYEGDSSDEGEDGQVTLVAARGERRVVRGRGHHNFQRRAPREECIEHNVGSIKLKLPKFYGKTDPEEYLEWEKTVKLIFDCHNFSYESKVRLCVTQFKQYAQTWWDNLMLVRGGILKHQSIRGMSSRSR